MALIHTEATHSAVPRHPWTCRFLGWLRRPVLVGFTVAVLCSSSGMGQFQTQESSISLKLRPERIEMGTFYNGARVRIEGTAPAGSGVLVIVRGAEKNEICNRKARVGPIWLNTDRMHFSGAPCFFLSFSSDDVNSLLDRAVVDKYQLDEAAIKKRMGCRIHCKCPVTEGTQVSSGPLKCEGVVPDASYGELILSGYLALKVNEGSYQTLPTAVRVADSGRGTTHYSVEFVWPKKGAQGSYRVEAYACRNRSVVAQSTASLDVAEVGFPAWMASLAGDRAWTYSLLAVAATLLAGFGIDAVAARLRRPKPRRGPPTGKALSSEDQAAERMHATSAHAPEDEHAHHR